MNFYGQVLINGLLLGGLYALVAVGLALYFGTLRLVNLAHGEFVVLGAFLAFAFYASTGTSPLLIVPVVLLIGSAIGLVLYQTLIRRARRGGETTLILATFGLSIAMVGLMRLSWGTTSRTLNSGSEPLHLLGFTIPTARLLAFTVALALSLLLYAVLRHTSAGRQVRAVADNEGLAAASGISVERVFRWTFATGLGLACAAGVLIGFVISADADTGAGWTFKAFAVVAAGGLGSMPGALVVGVGLGVSEALAGATVGSRLAELVAFALLVAVLLLRRREEIL